MNDLYREIFSRNIGFFTEDDQEKLQSSTIAIVGMGGVGGLLAERLIRLGIGNLRLFDADDFELSNLNRHFCSSILNVGQNKAEVVSNQLRDINPCATIYHSKFSIKTQSDADSIVSGCDLVIDEMDFGMFRESIFLQRAARQRGIYYLFACDIGFGAVAVAFDPKGLTLEEYDRLEPNTDLDKVDEIAVPVDSVCPILPSYIASIPETIMQEIISGVRPGTTNSIGVGLAVILAANEATNILLNKRTVVSAPQYTYVDLVDQRFVIGTIA